MYEYAAVLARVVDADTVRLVLDLGFHMTRREQPYRLLRINAPEISTEEGKAAKAWMEMFLKEKPMRAVTQKSDNFGRYLCELYAGNENVSDSLVAAGMATYKVY